jgi:hypothetical protein
MVAGAADGVKPVPPPGGRPGLTVAEPEVGEGSGGLDTLGMGRRPPCAIATGGSIECWGREEYGLSTYSRIGGGMDYACWLTADGQLACWGRNDDGETDLP